MENSLIKDNHEYGKVGEWLRVEILPDSKLSFVSAFFTIYAYDKLKAELDSIEELRFLFGEPSFLKGIDPDKQSIKSFEIQDNTIQLLNRLSQSRIAKECEDWIRSKVQIKSIKKPNFLHGKLYHITQKNSNENALMGSSNFTVKGLGLSDAPNLELNTVIDSKGLTRDLKKWFDIIWENPEIVEDVKEQVLEYLQKLYKDVSPEFLYYKTLYHIFEDFINDKIRLENEKRQIQLEASEIWKELYEFQKDGVKGAIQKLEKYNGCILADSVGLGKTYEALGVIKYYESRGCRVLVLTPKKLRENWTTYLISTGSELNPFPNDRFNYTVLNHTDLRDDGKQGDIDLSIFNWDMYDLLVIDESHNFRNNTKGKQDEEGNRKKSRYEKLMEDVIQKGVNTKVLLLSATPVNVHLKDLRNQIYFFTRDSDSAFKDSLGIESLNSILANAQRQFTLWADPVRNQNRKVTDLLSKLPPLFFKLLDELTIARSRKHIEKYYPENMAKIGKFPTRLKPDSIYSQIDLQDEFPSYESIEETIRKYKLSLFNPFSYLREDKKIEYEKKYTLNVAKNLTQKDREFYLVGMMKVNFLKRLESSIFSFQVTVKRTMDKIKDLIKRLEEAQKLKSKLEYEVESELKEEDDDILGAMETGGKIKYKLIDMDLEKWKLDLQNDLDKIKSLNAQAQLIKPERDAKLNDLKKLIQAKIDSPSINLDKNENRKVIVFTAFSDTATYLYKELESFATANKVHIALVVGSGENKTTLGESKFQSILTNFSPVSKKRFKLKNFPQKEEIDILIATDCISEGQNLQDCDYLVNYDIHWNPVRVIQRFGRIDRLGSRNETVKLVNFWPTKDLDHYIKLKTRVESRMALVDISATNEDNILSGENLEELVDEDMKYRDLQIKKLQKEVLDMEDLQDTITLSDFTLDDFRFDLIGFLNKNKKALKESPDGIYAIVKNIFTSNDEPKVSVRTNAGVIFLLKNKSQNSLKETINPYHPFYLVYMKSDGNLEYGYTNPKQILDVYRSLCAGKKEPLEELCKQFDRETEDGSKMEAYSQLIKSSIDSIVGRVKKANFANLGYGGSGKLEKESNLPTKTDDFELITWLIVKEN
jgi:superfamily II DNA/RNA helicase